MKPLLFLSTALLLTTAVHGQPDTQPQAKEANGFFRPPNFLPRYDWDEENPLEKAVTEDNAPKVLELIRANPALRSSMGIRLGDIRPRFLPSPLYAAISQNKLKVARALLDTGSDANTDFLLGVALRKQDESWRSLAELLIEKGAKVDGPTDQGESPLTNFLDVPFQTREKWDFLLQHGASVLVDKTAKFKGDGHPLIERAFEKNTPDSWGAMLDFIPVSTFVETFPYEEGLRETTLHMAVRLRNVPAVQQLTKRGSDLAAHDSRGQTPLDRAVEKNDELLQVLLQAGARPEQNSLVKAIALFAERKTWKEESAPSASTRFAKWLAPLAYRLRHAPTAPGKYSPLMRALETHDSAVLQLILDVQPPANDRERFFLAASQGDIEIMKNLLKRSPELISAPLPQGETPLHFAAFWNREQAVRLLCSRGANANIRMQEGQTPLYYALYGASPTQMVQVRRTVAALFAGKANPNDSGQGLGELSYMINPALGLAVATGDKELLRQFIDAGANPKGIHPYVNVPLEIAIDKGDADLVQLLLERGANPNIISTTDMSPLMSAMFATNPGLELSRLLLRFGADINLKNSQGKTALSFLVGGMNSHGTDEGLAKIRFALQHGAAPDVMSDDGPPLLSSLSDSFVGAANFETENGLEKSKKLRSNLLAIARLLLETKRVPLHAVAPYASPLETAVAAKTPEMVVLLLEFGADPNEKNAAGKTPLDIARELGKTEMVTLMEASTASKLVVH